jgi:hypothetical protein
MKAEQKLIDPIELRRMIALGALVSAVAAFLASLWFFDTYTWNHNATLYLPWSWAVVTSNPGTVLNLVYYVSIASLIVGLLSAYELGRLK